MRRRSLLTACGTALAASVAGCSDAPSGDANDGTTDPSSAPATGTSPARSTAAGSSWDPETPDGRPDVDCTAASRPEAAAPEGDDAVRPIDYPDAPPEPLTGDAALRYVEGFEKAYRRHREIRRAAESDGGALVEYGMGIRDSWVSDAPEDGILVRLRYLYSGTVERGAVYDSAAQFVTYYVDRSVVVRAHAAGGANVDASALDPDPWESGEPVACFE